MKKSYFVSYVVSSGWSNKFGSLYLVGKPDYQNLLEYAQEVMKEKGYKEGEYAFISMNEIPY